MGNVDCCHNCNKLVHRICQSIAERDLEITPFGEEKLSCPNCHPETFEHLYLAQRDNDGFSSFRRAPYSSRSNNDQAASELFVCTHTNQRTLTALPPVKDLALNNDQDASELVVCSLMLL